MLALGIAVSGAVAVCAALLLAQENRLLKRELRWTREANNRLLNAIDEHTGLRK